MTSDEPWELLLAHWRGEDGRVADALCGLDVVKTVGELIDGGDMEFAPVLHLIPVLVGQAVKRERYDDVLAIVSELTPVSVTWQDHPTLNIIWPSLIDTLTKYQHVQGIDPDLELALSVLRQRVQS